MLLVVNTGSRSVKLSGYALGAPGGEAVFRRELTETAALDTPAAALAELDGPVACTVHRLVHGGELIARPTWWSPVIAEALPALAALAPLHNPRALLWLTACQERWPAARHLLVPDTGFFHDLPDVARRLPLPAEVCQRHGLRRFGFHGLAHESLWRALTRVAPGLAAGRVISLQLGGGASAAALDNGRPIDTSMGFTPLEGLVMATRPGDLDAGVLLHLLRSGDWDAASLDRLLNRESGLLALSGVSSDMRALQASEAPAAREAVAQFVYRVRHYLGAYAVALGGVDAVLFGGGIGCGSAAIRAAVLEGLDWLGLTLDARRNAEAPPGVPITTPDSRASAWVFANEEDGLLRELALRAIEELAP